MSEEPPLVPDLQTYRWRQQNQRAEPETVTPPVPQNKYVAYPTHKYEQAVRWANEQMANNQQTVSTIEKQNALIQQFLAANP